MTQGARPFNILADDDEENRQRASDQRIESRLASDLRSAQGGDASPDDWSEIVELSS